MNWEERTYKYFINFYIVYVYLQITNTVYRRVSQAEPHLQLSQPVQDIRHRNLVMALVSNCLMKEKERKYVPELITFYHISYQLFLFLKKKLQTQVCM